MIAKKQHNNNIDTLQSPITTMANQKWKVRMTTCSILILISIVLMECITNAGNLSHAMRPIHSSQPMSTKNDKIVDDIALNNTLDRSAVSTTGSSSSSWSNFAGSSSPSLRIPTGASSLQSEKTNKSFVLFYQDDYSHFVESIASCIYDSYCHILYHHVQKTGGSYIASKLFPLLNYHDPKKGNNDDVMMNTVAEYHSKSWCCTSNFMKKKFLTNSYQYCMNLRFGPYEVWGNQFSQVLNTCREHARSDYNNNNTNISTDTTTTAKNRHHYFIGLISIREPIQRTISQIHQQCNTGYRRKEPWYQEKCRQCHYDDDDTANNNGTVFWEREFINDTNKAYRQVAEMVQQEQQVDEKERIPLYFLDSSMISSFFHQLQNHFQKTNFTDRTHLPQRANSNSEKTNICNFAMPSVMARKLAPSLWLYNNRMEKNSLDLMALTST